MNAVLIWTRQNNVHIFGKFCLRQSDERTKHIKQRNVVKTYLNVTFEDRFSNTPTLYKDRLWKGSPPCEVVLAKDTGFEAGFGNEGVSAVSDPVDVEEITEPGWRESTVHHSGSRCCEFDSRFLHRPSPLSVSTHHDTEVVPSTSLLLSRQ